MIALIATFRLVSGSILVYHIPMTEIEDGATMILVLAEKPSVGRELARVLGCTRRGEGFLSGGNYIVTWALGHLVTLADPDAYDEKYKRWRMEDLPMLPEKMKLVVIKESAKQFKVVKSLMDRADVTEFIIATDAGREGELVARWIMEKARWKGTAKRLWISSQTDKAIRDGFQSLRPAADYDHLFKSARARSEADWLVGLNVTRALTCKFGAQLSAGRVQTPTLALIVRREEEIRGFVPKDYWGVRIQAGGVTASWRDSTGSGRIFERKRAEELANRLRGKTCTVKTVDRKKKIKQPPAAYDLTELQRDANKKYAYSAKETLRIMQRLYEFHKVLTYPRTDSRYITDDIIPTLPDRLRAVNEGPYRDAVKKLLSRKPLETKYIVNNEKVSDHHAIIPTEEPPDFRAMSGEEQNIYDLVVRRFLAVLSPPASFAEVKMTLEAEGELFYVSGRVVTEPGWMELGGAAPDEEDAEDEETVGKSLPELAQGARLKITETETPAKKTTPPARYTEASLLTAMEKPTSQVESRELKKVLQETSGLGTPATRADIIEKLFSTFYVERQGKELVPTSKGIQIIDIVPEDLRSAELTARWEQRLSAISKGEAKDKDFIRDMREYATNLVTAVRSSEASYRHDNVTKDKCPDCGKYLLEVNGKRGKQLICPDRACGYRKSLSVATNARCPNCHKKLELRGEGEKRMFVCICGHREKLSDFEKRKTSSGASKRDVAAYMNRQEGKAEEAPSALAEQLAKWMDS